MKLNLAVVFEARRIKDVTPLRATETVKQLIISVSRREISTFILIVWLLCSSSVGVVYVCMYYICA